MPSDSEDDSDYAPPADIESDSEHDDEPETKRARMDDAETTRDNPGQKQRDREALWAEFQASVSTPSDQASRPEIISRLVKIERCFRYAGEEVVEIAEVPEDSEEARKWPRWRPPSEDNIPINPPARPGPSSETGQTKEPSPITQSASMSTPKPSIKRPGPRKPKTALAPLPSAQKAKRLTTLDKSAMDWRSHVQTEQQSELKDELEANRRGGGYLEKVEFLQRVEDRKAEVLDTSKSKRRRG